ncbi:hypothetical protein PoB_003790400 [Plakobranchus ocellatus]|uniref:Uncharacterized protein n=1 Tax=Plakobranchus ocellatus TaxID=259542 RepID=A0AAV4AZ51_9GAST|nr:hypothetical protein PoB_003790400 [Plakobranchus ocellatus]
MLPFYSVRVMEDLVMTVISIADVGEDDDDDDGINDVHSTMLFSAPQYLNWCYRGNLAVPMDNSDIIDDKQQNVDCLNRKH